MASRIPKMKVLLIGWDAADWKIIHALVDAGKMPNLSKFIEEGVIGNLATLNPQLSPMLWTSIATGKRPFKHGILGFIEPDPHGGGVRPITNLSRKTKAIWNILSQTGMKCNVVGWWPSHPAEPINGVMVSNLFQRAVAPFGEPWPLRPGAIHPERLTRNLAALRVHPQELEVGLIMNFIPRLAEIDQEKDRRVENLAKIIADCTTINKAATALMLHEPWDFTAVYFDAIDHFSHGFMNYHPPRLSWVNERDYELYHHVVESGYIYHDLLLGTLLDLADEDTTVMIVSDHGFHSDHLRPKGIPREPAGPAAQHRPYGILAVRGPGIIKDEIIYGASLLDICPTILTIFGLPVGKDMDGKPLISLFHRRPGIETVQSWDGIPGEDGGHSPDKKIDPIEAKEAINQLVALGYIERPNEDNEKAAEESLRELRYNHACSLMDAGLYVKALPVFKELLDRWSDEYRFGIQLVHCYQGLGKTAEARAILEALFDRKKENAREAAGKLKRILKEHESTPFTDLGFEEQRELRMLRAEASRSPYAMEYLMGSLLFAEGKKKEAIAHLMKAEKADRRQPALHVKLGEVYLKMKCRLDAERSFNKALSIDPENAEAHLGLCQSYLQVRKNVEAAEAALTALGLRYHNPRGHYLLGTALHRMGRIDQAIEALTVAMTQNPCYPEVYRRLAHIYQRRLKDPILAEKYRALAERSLERIKAVKEGAVGTLIDQEESAQTSLTSSDEILHRPLISVPEGPLDLSRTVVIVSGLPRSGTSMMMQMLAAGGIPPLTDGSRQADESNPKGYFEYEKTKQLSQNASWLHEARGKSVKVVAQLLSSLPPMKELDYLIIFMERPLEQVVSSQREMLRRKGKAGTILSDERLRNVFLRQINQAKWFLSVKKIPTLFVDYDKTTQNPADTITKLASVLGESIDKKKMVEAVDPALRHRYGTDEPYDL
jgi:predicted AlkP superfamily phosphohydrolase/phosphomutase/tetratricopeptide (TPR) repeat protein